MERRRPDPSPEICRLSDEDVDVCRSVVLNSDAGFCQFVRGEWLPMQVTHSQVVHHDQSLTSAWIPAKRQHLSQVLLGVALASAHMRLLQPVRNQLLLLVRVEWRECNDVPAIRERHFVSHRLPDEYQA